MVELSDAQVIEVFHLQFLQVLTSRRSDWFVLKGGANLRYFFGSVRYSNDIDLDFWGVAGHRVQERVEKVLRGVALKMLLGLHEIEISDCGEPKQTETTRRWKVGLRFIGTAATRRPIRTKIEFSGRSESPSEFSADPVPTSVVDPYRVASPIVNHYRAAAAADQKVAALALRSETKARDVFDLDLLFRRYGRDFMRPLSSEHAEQAAQKGSTVTYDNFRSEVLAFLDPDLAEIYSKAQWEVLHDGVIATLRELAAARDSGG